VVPRVDVLAEDFRPGYMERVGLGYERLRALNPRLIYAAASAFGPKGPLAGRPGYDHIAQAVSGLMIEQAGLPGHRPVPALPRAADHVRATHIAPGLPPPPRRRGPTGPRAPGDVPALGSVVPFQGRQITRFLYTGKQGRERFRRSPVYSHYRAADGWVAIAAQDPKRWAPLCRALGRPDLIDDPRFAGPWERHHHAAELEAELEAIFIQRPVAEWLARLTAEDVPCGPVNDYRALVQDGDLPAQVAANDYIVTVDHPNLRRIRTAGLPIHLSDTPAGPVQPAPELGQHTEEILLDLGYSWPEIEDLKRKAVI